MLERTEPPSVENLTEARRAIEAMLLVANDPTPVHLLAQLVELPVDLVQSMCQELAADYEAGHRGFQLVEVAGGWRYQTHPDTHAYVERFALEGVPNRLSNAALETLAIVAYKQPISRAQIGAIRGVNVDGVLRTLVQRGYVDEQGRDDGPGQATLFGTTPFFLEQLGLMSLDDLPPLGDFVPSVEVLEALENTLRVDQGPDIVIVDDEGGGSVAPEAPPEVNGASATTNGSTSNGFEADAAGSNGIPDDRSPAAQANGVGPDDDTAIGERAAGVELDPVADDRTDEQPVFEIMGDPTDHVISLDAESARSSTDGLEQEAEVEAPPEPETGPRPAVDLTDGAERQPAEVRVPGTADNGASEAVPQDDMPTDELEVAADPGVEMTDRATATGAAGADDARFPGAGAAPPTDDPHDLDPGEGTVADLGRSASPAAAAGGRRPTASSTWSETVIDGLRDDPGNGDA